MPGQTTNFHAHSIAPKDIAKQQTDNKSETKDIHSKEETSENTVHMEDDDFEELEAELSSLKKELS